MSTIPKLSTPVTCKFFYQLGLAEVRYKGPLTRDCILALRIHPSTIIYKADFKKTFPDGSKVSVFIPEMKTSELLERLEKSEASQEISPTQETLLPKDEVITQDTRSLWKRNKRVMTIASLLLISGCCLMV